MSSPATATMNPETQPDVAPAALGPVKNSPRTEVIGPQQLRKYEAVWAKLATSAAVPNVFYEPWMLLPAVDHLSDGTNLQFLLVFGPAAPDGTEDLWGFFPLNIQPKTLGLPVRTLAFWQHRYCFLSVPLIHEGHVWPVLEAFWRWFERNPFQCRILDTNYLLVQGSFHFAWADFTIGRASLALNEYPRAALEPAASAQDYIANQFSKKHQYEFRRWERRLSESGPLVYEQVETEADAATFVDEFLAVEAGGWKGGSGGGAFATNTKDADYLRALTREGFARKSVMLLSLRVGGKAIALKHNLLTADGCFTFKIAFDESYSKYSPGVLLELENIRRVHDGNRIKWLDSCAVARHSLMNRVWGERRMIRRTLFSDTSWIGDLWIASIPLIRWISKRIKPGQTASYLQISTKQTKSGDS